MKKIMISIGLLGLLYIFMNNLFETQKWQMETLINISSVLQSQNSLISERAVLDAGKLKADNQSDSFLELADSNHIVIWSGHSKSRDFYFQTHQLMLFIPSSMKVPVFNLFNIDQLLEKDNKISASTMANDEEYQVDLVIPWLNSPVQDQVQISPVFEENTNSSIEIVLMAHRQEDIQLLKAKFSNYFSPSQLQGTDEPVHIPSSEEFLQTFWNNSFLILYSSSILLIFIVFLGGRKREIGIHKLNGTNTLQIFNRVTLSPILCNLSIIPVVLVGMVLIGVPTNIKLQYYFIQTFIPFILTHFTTYLFLAVLSILFIYHSGYNLKTYHTKARERIALILTLISSACLGLIARPFVTAAIDLSRASRTLITMVTQKDKLTGYLTDSFWDVKVSDAKGKDYHTVIGLWNSFLEENNAIYEDFGLFDFVYFHPITLYPSAIVNKVYLKEYSIYKEDGSLLNLDSFSPEDFPLLLVSSENLEKIKNDKNDKYYQNVLPNSKIILIKSNLAIYPHLLPAYDSYALPYRDPIVQVIDKMTNNYGQRRFLKINGGETQKMVEQFLIKNDLSGIFGYSKNDVSYEAYWQDTIISLIKSLILILIYLTCIVVILKNLLLIYLDINKRTIAVRFHFGASYLKKYTFWWEASGVLGCCFLLNFFLLPLPIESELFCLFFFLLTYASVTWITIHKFEKSRIYRILKGDEGI